MKHTLSPSLFVLLLIGIEATVAANTNEFRNPPAPGPTKDYSNNPTYNIGEVIQLGWAMNFTGAKLTLDQDNKPGDMVGGASAVILQSTNLQGLHWRVSYEQLDPTINNVFYFTITSDHYTFTSHYFYISGTESSSTSMPISSTTSAAVSSLSRSTSTSGPSSTSSSTSTASASPTIVIPNDPALSGGSIAGIAVGATLGTVGIVAAIVFFVSRWLRNRKTGVPNGFHRSKGSPQPESIIPVGRGPELGGVPVVEVDGRNMAYGHQPHFWRHEMPT